MVHPGGRPLKFKTPEALQKKIDAYFDECIEQSKPISITGLANYLDTFRQTLCNYETKDEFFDTIKRAKQRVEQFYEEKLTLANATGSIFALKNFEWTDKQDIAHSGGVAVAAVTFTPEQNQAGIDAIMRYQSKHKEEK